MENIKDSIKKNTGNFEIKNLDRFFYEYALYKNIDISSLDISQKDLNVKLTTIYTNFFQEKILDTIYLVDKKNFLVKLENYSLGKYDIKISESIFELFKSKEKLSGIITLEFDRTRELFYISNFEEWDFDFSLEQCLDFNLDFKDLLNALGYNESNLLFREKISILARLLPFVEKNINIMEITKPEVGKSYIFDELFTKNSIVKKVGDLTEANLFSSLKYTNDDSAILKNYSVLCIDEFHKGDLKNIIAGLQTFMENGKVSRGNKSYSSKTSIIMFANLKENIYKKIFIEPDKFNPFKSIPYIDKAFLQRINYVNPSFGMRSLKNSMFLSKEDSRISITFYENFFNYLRNLDINLKNIFPNLKITSNGSEISRREYISFKKTASGFIKLLFPKLSNKISNKNNNIINNLDITDYDQLNICFYLALEGISFLKNMQQPTSLTLYYSDKILELGDSFSYQQLIFYFNNKRTNIQYDSINQLPHRTIFLNRDYDISIPLDTLGIEENIRIFKEVSSYYKNNDNYNYNDNYHYNEDNHHLTISTSLNKLKFNYTEIYPYYFNFLFGYNHLENLDNFPIASLGNLLYYKDICCPYCNTPLKSWGAFKLKCSSYNCSHYNKKFMVYDILDNIFKDFKD